jgi:hypothetical protein
MTMMPCLKSDVAPRLCELDDATEAFTDAIVDRAAQSFERELRREGVVDATAARLRSAASRWREAVRDGDDRAAADAVAAVRDTFREMLVASRFSETSDGRALGAAAGRYVAAVTVADHARRIADLVGRA